MPDLRPLLDKAASLGHLVGLDCSADEAGQRIVLSHSEIGRPLLGRSEIWASDSDLLNASGLFVLLDALEAKGFAWTLTRWADPEESGYALTVFSKEGLRTAAAEGSTKTEAVLTAFVQALEHLKEGQS